MRDVAKSMIWVFLVVALVLFVGAARNDFTSPLTVHAGLWLGIAAVLASRWVPVLQPGGASIVVLAVGLSVTTAPVFLRFGPPKKMVQTISSRAFVCVAVVCVIAGIAAAAYFRLGVEGTTGSAFDHLTQSQIRQVQTSGAIGGPLALLSAIYPIIAALGILGSVRLSRWWLLLVGGSLLLSLQTPARLTTLILLVSSVVFYLYVGRAHSERSPPDLRVRSRIRIVGLIFLSLLISLAFFILWGARLGKNATVDAHYPGFSGPSFLLSPLLYFVGGVPAFDVAIQSDENPLADGGSLYAFLRLAKIIQPSISVPDPHGDYVRIPGPFNVFTGYGQMWLDYHWSGVLLLSAALGLIAWLAHRRAKAGSLSWAWIASVIWTLLLSMPQAFRLFFLDTAFQIIAGGMAFWLITWGGRRRLRVSVVERWRHQVGFSGRAHP